MKPQLSEDSLVEQPAVNCFKRLGYSYIYGPQLSPDNGERESLRDVVLKRRFIQAIKRINPWLNDELAEQVYKKVVDLEHPDFVVRGKNFYTLLKQGVKVTVKDKNRDIDKIVKIIDFENPDNNEFLIANQFTVEFQFEKDLTRRPDLVVFINGLPIAIFEFKGFNADETAKDAFNDHKMKKEDIPQLYAYAQILVASDGLETKYGSPTSDWERFFVWEGIFSDDDLEVREIEEGYYRYFYKGKELTSLEVLLNGLFRKEHLLEYIEDFIFYEKIGETYQKKIAMFHQFYAVKKAIERTKKCVLEGKTPEEKRIGVVWHTQGTGKSLTMLFYAIKALKQKELENPLLLFITDRSELDDQLSEEFSFMPIVKHAESIKDLQESVRTTQGGIIFATIQKFGKGKDETYPFLTDRKNIIVIADEAHRSQYRELAKNLRMAIPNASFMGFTATPIEVEDRDTYLVFGEPISVYSIDKAKRHRVVVPIYYEARLSKLHLTNEFIDEEFEEISEFMDPEEKETLKKKFANLEKLILNEERLSSIAKDIVEHFNKRCEEIKGKGMIVTISRTAAVRLYEEIKKLPDAPTVAVVFSGSRKDPKEFWPHLKNKNELKRLKDDFKNPDKDPKMVIVVDMLLTGFDVPCLHTMYFDKPMKDHSLAQAIARVNRVFKDKPGGLIVDYIGIADDLRKSLSRYTEEAIDSVLKDINKVLVLLREKYDIITSMFNGVDYKKWKELTPEELSRLTIEAYERISSEDANKKAFIKNFIALKKLYALASPHPETFAIKDDIRFFEMVKKMAVKYSNVRMKEISRDLEYEINELLSESISAEEPVDVLELLRREKPEISFLDDNFLAQFKEMAYKNYAKDLLIKIINDEIRAKMKKNPIRYKPFHEKLEKVIEDYNKRLITIADIISELIEIAKEIREKQNEGKALDLSEEELAFYDLLSSMEGVFTNYNEIREVAKKIARELGYYVKIVDWNKKEQIKAKIKIALKKVLMNNLGTKIDYGEYDKIASKILDQAEKVYAS